MQRCKTDILEILKEKGYIDIYKLLLLFDSVQSDRNLHDIMLNLKKEGILLKVASERVKNNKEIVLLAVKQNGLALEFASDELKNNIDIIKLAVEQNGLAIHLIKKEFQQLPQFNKYLINGIIINQTQIKRISGPISIYFMKPNINNYILHKQHKFPLIILFGD